MLILLALVSVNCLLGDAVIASHCLYTSFVVALSSTDVVETVQSPCSQQRFQHAGVGGKFVLDEVEPSLHAMDGTQRHSRQLWLWVLAGGESAACGMPNRSNRPIHIQDALSDRQHHRNKARGSGGHGKCRHAQQEAGQGSWRR